MSQTSEIPGVGLPADPETGLPVQVLSSGEFGTWLGTVLGAALLAGLLFFSFSKAFPVASPEEQARNARIASLDGQALFERTCGACHGAQGQGVPGLGKDMTTSAFIQGLDDAELVAFVRKGRDANDPANTTKVPMPASGGNPKLTDDELFAIVTHIRKLSQ